MKKKAAKEPKAVPTAASTKRKAKESPDQKTKEQGTFYLIVIYRIVL